MRGLAAELSERLAQLGYTGELELAFSSWAGTENLEERIDGVEQDRPRGARGARAFEDESRGAGRPSASTSSTQIPVAGVVWHPIPPPARDPRLRRQRLHREGRRPGRRGARRAGQRRRRARGAVHRRSGHATSPAARRRTPPPARWSSSDPRPAQAVAEEEGTVVLAVGGEPGSPYKVSPWEYYFAAAPPSDGETLGGGDLA